jgi:hypothetical protein
MIISAQLSILIEECQTLRASLTDLVLLGNNSAPTRNALNPNRFIPHP